MKSFLSHRSRRWGYDGWALRIRGALQPLDWTVSTTRAEVRQLRRERGDIFLTHAEIVKVKVSVEVVESDAS